MNDVCLWRRVCVYAYCDWLWWNKCEKCSRNSTTAQLLFWKMILIEPFYSTFIRFVFFFFRSWGSVLWLSDLMIFIWHSNFDSFIEILCISKKRKKSNNIVMTFSLLWSLERDYFTIHVDLKLLSLSFNNFGWKKRVWNNLRRQWLVCFHSFCSS